MGKIDRFLCFIIAYFIRVIYRKRLLILNYHRVLYKNELFFSSDIDENMFDWQMELVSRYFKVFKLQDAVQMLYAKQLPVNAIVVTFDDGYKDNIDQAIPILKKWEVPTTFFIATGFLNGGIMWNDVIIESIKSTNKKSINLTDIGLNTYEIINRKQKIQVIQKIITHIKYQDTIKRADSVKFVIQQCKGENSSEITHLLMMEDTDIKRLKDMGMEIGGHTVSHPILSCETDSVVEKEISSGKVYLENLLDTSLTSFAYPNGKLGDDYQAKHSKMVEKMGFCQAVTTNWGLNAINTPRFELNRFTPWDKSPVRFMLRILKLYLFNKV